VTVGAAVVLGSAPMKRVDMVWKLALAAALCAAPIGVLGCTGGEGGDARHANVSPGTMPQGADWSGVYYSELYGFLHLVQDGTSVSGRWIRPTKNKCGEVHGTITGDVIKFSWKEHTIGAVGPNSASAGRGYFKYKRPQGDNVDDTIVGEIGKGQDEVGDPWDAIKQRNMPPDPKSIQCSGGAGDLGGGDWDKENKEQGAPEAPKPPPSIPQP
jgi:hypothetical protein